MQRYEQILYPRLVPEYRTKHSPKAKADFLCQHLTCNKCLWGRSSACQIGKDVDAEKRLVLWAEGKV